MQISKKCDAAQVCKLRRKIALGANAAQGYLVPFPRPAARQGVTLPTKYHIISDNASPKRKNRLFFSEQHRRAGGQAAQHRHGPAGGSAHPSYLRDLT
jgi:hypothetical protein